MMISDYSKQFSELTFNQLDESILGIQFNSSNLNALSLEAHRDISSVWDMVDRDDRISSVVISGAGGTFSAGGSFDTVGEVVADYGKRVALMKDATRLVHGIINCRKPIISAIRGAAAGAGLAVGLLADISIAAHDAKLVDGHTRLGIAAGDHAAICWPLLSGMAKAKYYLLTCYEISGREAERIGLVSLSVEDELVEPTALDVGRDLARGSADAIHWTKQSLNSWYRMMGPTFELSLALEMLGFSSPEVQEGVDSRLGRQSPKT